jgi:hypothetical protein
MVVKNHAIVEVPAEVCGKQEFTADNSLLTL